jgi:glycosyltransferase involved in cell wall biosynthesis
MDTIGYILRSFPRLSQTFILSEALALEERGVRLRLFPAIDPREPVVQPQVAEVRAPVRYLSTTDEAELQAAHAWLAHHAPERYAAARDYVRRRADLDEGYVAASRFYCFDQAVLLAEQLHLAGDVGHLHAHFAHDPTLVALLTQQLTGISFSFTAHARDLFQIPRHILVERVAAATAIVTCCGANCDYLDEVLPPELRGKVHLIHHGVNLDGFQPAPRRDPAPGEAPLILSVGRLVEKKGFPDLLRAVALLRGSGRQLRLAIYGDGPLRAELTALAEQLGIADCFELPGERPQRELVPALQTADIFALTPFVTDDGDRDGVPNVLAEAMACGVPVVSTAVSGIPELVRHGENGLLCAARDVETIAAALGRLLDDREERLRFGAAARRTVVEHFDLRTAAGRLAGLFEQAIGASTTEVGRPGPQPPAPAPQAH